MRWQRRRRLRLAPCADTWRPLSSARRMKASRCRIPATSQKLRFESCRWTCLVPARLNAARACDSWSWFETSSSPLTAIQTAYEVAVTRMLRGADRSWTPSSNITRRPSLIGSSPGLHRARLREMAPEDLWRRANGPGKLTWLSCRSRPPRGADSQSIPSRGGIRRSATFDRCRPRWLDVWTTNAPSSGSTRTWTTITWSSCHMRSAHYRRMAWEASGGGSGGPPGVGVVDGVKSSWPVCVTVAWSSRGRWVEPRCSRWPIRGHASAAGCGGGDVGPDRRRGAAGCVPGWHRVGDRLVDRDAAAVARAASYRSGAGLDRGGCRRHPDSVVHVLVGGAAGRSRGERGAGFGTGRSGRRAGDRRRGGSGGGRGVARWGCCASHPTNLLEPESQGRGCGDGCCGNASRHLPGRPCT
jgi:hypothetical protein